MIDIPISWRSPHRSGSPLTVFAVLTASKSPSDSVATLFISIRTGRKRDASLGRELGSDRPRQHYKSRRGSGDRRSPAEFLWRQRSTLRNSKRSARQDRKDSTRFTDGSGKPTSQSTQPRRRWLTSSKKPLVSIGRTDAAWPILHARSMLWPSGPGGPHRRTVRKTRSSGQM